MKQRYYIIDFDSTFTQVEALEELAEISLANDPEKDLIVEKIKQLTDMAMEGKMPFPASLKARIALLSAKKYHLQMLVNRLRKRVSESFVRNKKFFREAKGRVYIVSGGFSEFIVPVVKPYHIEQSHVFANTFTFDPKNNIIGIDEKNLLAQEKGKVKLLKKLKLKGEVVVIGDGFTDYEVFESGQAHQFYAYTENVSRKRVLELAENIAPSLDEILYRHKMPMALSYPKSRLKAVFWGERTFGSSQMFEKEGYRVRLLPENTSKTLLHETLADAQIFVADPRLNLNSIKGEAVKKLMCAGIWGEPMLESEAQIKSWSEKGICVFANSYAHVRSLTELVLSMIFELSRRNGEEVYGKRLGIVGYGHCGSLLSVLATSLGMEILYYDQEEKAPLGNALRARSPQEVFNKSDVVVLAMGRRFNNSIRMGKKELKQMKAGAVLINVSQDDSVDEIACLEALENKHLGGFGIDRINSKTWKKAERNAQVLIYDNQRMNTSRTQENLAAVIAEKITSFINTGNTASALQFPQIQLSEVKHAHRMIHIHQNIPGVLASINKIFAENHMNVEAQHLQTQGNIGYVISDVGKGYPEPVTEQLKAVKGTLRFRVLY